MLELGLPIVPGRTETAEDSVPIYQRLTEKLGARPFSSNARMTGVLTELEEIYRDEGDSPTRRRIAAAQAMLLGAGDPEDGAS